MQQWKLRDPIPVFSERLQQCGWLDGDALAAMETEIAAEVAQAVEFAEAGPWEPVADLMKDVYTRGLP